MNLQKKSILSISKQLNSSSTKLQSKITILGTDRTTFYCAITMALRQYVSEIVIFNQSYNKQMKIFCYDLACAFQLSSISRSVNLIYTSDISYTSRSDVIIINDISNNYTKIKKQQNKTLSFLLKENAEQFINNLHGNPSIIQHLLTISASPYDYNSLVVKSLAGNRCHAGQICGLGLNIYNHRLHYIISELLNISSKHITGFTLENTTKSVVPYWPSITINGQSITLNEEYFINQSISNNAPQDKYHMIKLNTIKNDKIVKIHKHSTKTLSNSNIKKNFKENINKKTINSPYINKKTSIRIQQWLQTIKNNSKHKKYYQTNISNNSINLIQLKPNLYQILQDYLIQNLNGWHCLQLLYNRPYYYTLAMNLSKITRSIMSDSQEILNLSTYIQSFFQQQSSNQIELVNNNLFVSIPILIRHYGIHAIINFKSQIKLYNYIRTILEQNRIFRDKINYPLQKTLLIYDIKNELI